MSEIMLLSSHMKACYSISELQWLVTIMDMDVHQVHWNGNKLGSYTIGC